MAACNSGLLDLGGTTAVFDTSLTPTAARDLDQAVRSSLGRRPSLVINSHWHLDHVLGNQEFPSMPIWSTLRSKEILVERQDELSAALTRESIEKDIRELEARQGSMRSDAAREDLEFNLQLNRAILSEVGRVTLVPPNHTFETHLSLPGLGGPN